MKVKIKIKHEMLHKLPRREMNLGNYIIKGDEEIFDIKQEDIFLLESDQANHWMDVEEVSVVRKKKKAKKVIEEEIIEEDEDNDEVAEG